MTEPSWPIDRPMRYTPVTLTRQPWRANPKITWDTARRSLVERERNNARGEHGHDGEPGSIYNVNGLNRSIGACWILCIAGVAIAGFYGRVSCHCICDRRERTIMCNPTRA